MLNLDPKERLALAKVLCQIEEVGSFCANRIDETERDFGYHMNEGESSLDFVEECVVRAYHLTDEDMDNLRAEYRKVEK